MKNTKNNTVHSQLKLAGRNLSEGWTLDCYVFDIIDFRHSDIMDNKL